METINNMNIYNKNIDLMYKYLSIIELYKIIKVSKKFYNIYRETDIKKLINKTNNKNEKLQIYLNYHKYLPKQGSVDWLKNKNGSLDKHPTVGGSEMAMFINNPRMLAEKKLNPNSFRGNIHTRWGNLFEEVLAMIIDFLFETSSSETGSIPGLKDQNGNIHQSYSPDRIMVIKLCILKKVLLSIFNGAIKNQAMIDELNMFIEKSVDEIIILNEFKNPSVKIPDGKIPKEYMYQLPTGMCTIPIIDLGLFTNASFRKCKFSDFLYNNNYDQEFHGKDKINIPEGFDNPICMGMVAIYEISRDTDQKKLNDTLLEKFINQLDFTEITEKNLCSNILLIKNELFNYLIKEKIKFPEIEELIIIIGRILIRYDISVNNFISNIIYDIIVNFKELVEEPNKKLYDLGEMSLGEFDYVLTKAIDHRHEPNGYHIYYPDNFISYFDEKNTEKDPKKWLENNISKFTNFCKIRNYRPIGFLPWKLFKICMIPVFPDPEFLHNYQDSIHQFVHKVHSIKQKAITNSIDSNQILEFYQSELNAEFREKRIVKSKEKEIIPKKTYDQSILDEFNDLS